MDENIPIVGEKEAAQPWISQDSPGTVKTMISKSERARAMREGKERYKAIADLMLRGSADIANTTDIFAYVNRPRSLEDDEHLSLEDYMKLFPEDCEEAIEQVKLRRSADEKDYNPKSFAKWRIQGFMPKCVATLFLEMYPESKARADAFKRFFNQFPKFRVSTKKI